MLQDTLNAPHGGLLVHLLVDAVWAPDRLAEVQAVYGTTNKEHPGVAAILDRSHPWLVGGRIEGLQLPTYYDYKELRLTPAEVREEFAKAGWTRVVAFQTRN